MTTRAAVDDFLAQKKLALVGASRTGRKFGNSALKELRAKGYEVVPVHPEAAAIDGVPCARSVAELPPGVGGVLISVPPARSEALVREAAAAGIERIWLQQGAESPAAIAFCESAGISVVHGECILMFAEPAAWFHRLHRGIWRVLGKLPKATAALCLAAAAAALAAPAATAAAGPEPAAAVGVVAKGRADLDGNGKQEGYTCTFLDRGGYEYDRVLVEVDLDMLPLRGEALSGKAVLVDIDKGDPFTEIALQEYGPSDDYAVHFVRYGNGTLRLLGTIPGLLDRMVFDGAGAITTECRGSILHTWFHPCVFAENPYRHTLERRVQQWWPMNTKVTLLVDLEVCPSWLSPDNPFVIKAGTKATITRTDNHSLCEIVTDEGTRGWFRVSGYGTIGKTGQSAMEVFEGLCSAD